MSPKLEHDEAYLAMFAFLDAHYSRTKSDDIGGLLGDMSLLPSGSPADPAVSEDWAKAVAAARAGKVDATMKHRRATI